MNAWHALDWANHRAKALTVRLHGGTHPKHLAGHQPTLAWLAQHCRPHDYMLDLGCGLGLHSYIATSRHWVAAALGIDKNVPTTARETRTCHYEQADLEQPLTMLSNCHHIVLALDIVEHLHNRTQFLLECHRVLVPGGRLLITAPNGASRWRKRLDGKRQDADHKIEYANAEVFTGELEADGFEVKSVEPITLDTPLAGWIDLSSVFSLRLYERLARWRVKQASRWPENSTGWRIVAHAR